MLENQNKKSQKWLWITIAIVAGLGVAAWCVYNAIVGDNGIKGVFSFSSLLVGLFIITVF